MKETVSSVFFSQQQIFERERTHPLRQYEVPVSHAISLAIPTLRAGIPGYAHFASPTTRVPEKPQLQGPPDRWWIFSALDGRLVLYALYSAFPFAPDSKFETVELVTKTLTMEEAKQRLDDIMVLFNLTAHTFFEGKAGNRMERYRLRELLSQHVSNLLEPQYRALAPDFFTWLEA